MLGVGTLLGCVRRGEKLAYFERVLRGIGL